MIHMNTLEHNATKEAYLSPFQSLESLLHFPPLMLSPDRLAYHHSQQDRKAEDSSKLLQSVAVSFTAPSQLAPTSLHIQLPHLQTETLAVERTIADFVEN